MRSTTVGTPAIIHIRQVFLGEAVLSNEWDEYAENWETDSSVQEYADKAFKALSTIVSFDGLSVLDFGCGTGHLTHLMSPKVNHVVALDGSSKMIERLAAKRLKNVSTISGFLTQDLIDTHPYLANKFDLIVASSVCGFLPEYEVTLGLLESLLKSGGIFIQWDWLSSDDNSAMGLTENRVLCAFEANGFKDYRTSKPFEMNSSKGITPVLMAVGVNP